MTGNDAASVIRNRIADEDSLNISDAALLANVNSAIRYVSQILISRRAPEMTTSEDIVDYIQIPQGFHSFAGQHPVYREGDVLRTYLPDSQHVRIRFFQMRKGIAALSEDIPFDDDYIDAVIEAAVILCLNKDEFDTSFEQSLLDKISNMLPGGGS